MIDVAMTAKVGIASHDEEGKGMPSLIDEADLMHGKRKSGGKRDCISEQPRHLI